jgi:hypothetical protein
LGKEYRSLSFSLCNFLHSLLPRPSKEKYENKLKGITFGKRLKEGETKNNTTRGVRHSVNK